MVSSKQLPGMEDNKIEALEQTAHDYAKVRDKRMKLTSEEVELKESLRKLLKRHHKETYRSDNVEISLVTEEETVKVRILRPPKPKSDGAAT